MESKRLQYLDYAKGIGILLMLFQHSMPQHNLWLLFIMSFVMPLFFIVGGFLMYHKEKNGKEMCISRTYFTRRLKRIGLPYLLGCLVLTLFFELLSITQGEHSIKGNIFRIITLQGVESMWFLPVYLFSEILFLLLAKYRRILYYSGILVLILLFFIVRFEYFPWPYALIVKTLMGFVFFIGGYLLASSQLIRRPFIYLVPLWVIGLCCAYFNGFASFAELHNPVLYLLSGLFISAFVLYFSLLLESKQSSINKVLNYFGRDTLLILCTNNLIIESIRLADYKITGSFLLHHGMQGTLIMFLCVSIAEATVIYFYRRLVDAL